MWIAWALVSALTAALVTILAKAALAEVPSSLATALRTVVIVPFAFAIAALTGETARFGSLSKRTLLLLAASGLATGVSWLAYFRALQMAPASKVAPIDKLSLVFTVLLAALWLAEPLSPRIVVGALLILGGTWLIVA
jgi:transporter family protein